jgi:hypothetical protein
VVAVSLRVEVWRESDLAFRLTKFDIATRPR